MNARQAKCTAFGSNRNATVAEYHAAWQWLYDNEVKLDESDSYMMDKLICDGHVKPKPGYFD